MNIAEMIVELTIAELAIQMRAAYAAASKLSTFPVEILQRRDDNSSHIDAMLAVIAKAGELKAALDEVYKLDGALIERAKAVAETGKAAVPA